MDEILNENPGLIEEILAIVARSNKDSKLADTVFRISETKGGLLEAYTTMALIRGDSFLDELLAYERQCQNDFNYTFKKVVSERIASILIEWETPDSITTLAKLCLQKGNRFSKWNLVSAAIKSQAAAETIQAFLTKEKYWCYPNIQHESGS